MVWTVHVCHCMDQVDQVLICLITRRDNIIVKIVIVEPCGVACLHADLSNAYPTLLH